MSRVLFERSSIVLSRHAGPTYEADSRRWQLTMATGIPGPAQYVELDAGELATLAVAFMAAATEAAAERFER